MAVVDSCFDRLKEDVLEKGTVVSFNARVGRSADVDDVIVIGMFGEDTCNTSGNRRVSFLNEVKLVACNGRKFVMEPEWMRVRPTLKQNSIIDYILTDNQLVGVSGHVQVDSTGIDCSDHYLVWMELGKATKTTKRGSVLLGNGI